MQTGTSDDCRKHHVDLRIANRAGNSLRADQQFNTFRQGRPIERPCLFGIRENDPTGAKSSGLLASRSRLLWAERTLAQNSPPELAMTSSAFRPMLPVDPSTAMFFPGGVMGRWERRFRQRKGKVALYENPAEAATWLHCMPPGPAIMSIMRYFASESPLMDMNRWIPPNKCGPNRLT